MSETNNQASSGRADYVAVHHILSCRLNELAPQIRVDVPTFEDGQRVTFRLSGPKKVVNEVSWQRITEPLEIVGYTDTIITPVRSTNADNMQEILLSVKI